MTITIDERQQLIERIAAFGRLLSPDQRTALERLLTKEQLILLTEIMSEEKGKPQ